MFEEQFFGERLKNMASHEHLSERLVYQCIITLKPNFPIKPHVNLHATRDGHEMTPVFFFFFLIAPWLHICHHNTKCEMDTSSIISAGFKYICFGCRNYGLGVSGSSFRRLSFGLFYLWSYTTKQGEFLSLLMLLCQSYKSV